MNRPFILRSLLLTIIVLAKPVLASAFDQTSPSSHSGQKQQPPTSGGGSGGMAGSSGATGASGAAPYYAVPVTVAGTSSSGGWGKSASEGSPEDAQAELIKAQTKVLVELSRKVDDLSKRLGKLEKRR